MAVTLITIREQLSGQRFTLDDSFLDLARSGRTFSFEVDKDKPSPLMASLGLNAAGVPELVCNTSYFIGYVWLIPGRLAVHVEPKMNNSGHDVEVDYLAMLDEALADPENLQHLDGLLVLNAKAAPVPLQKEEFGLSLFLLIQFLTVIDRLRRRGLKRGFYDEEETFSFGMKGCLLLSKSLRAARTPTLTDRLTCSVQQFDLNTPANQYLKRALRLALRLLQSPALKREKHLIECARLALSAFALVEDKPDAAPVKVKKVNPVFRDYAEALRLAELVIAAGVAGHRADGGRFSVTPYWIDMAKLFELFAFKKLRQAAVPDGRVEYQFVANRQYLDFLCHFSSGPVPYVIADAKYKPRCEEHVAKEDLRQLAGYARLTKVEETLRRWKWSDPSRLIPCLVIYPTLESGAEAVDWRRMKGVDRWVDFFKLDVSLPLKATSGGIGSK